jgi:hypothetical protein
MVDELGKKVVTIFMCLRNDNTAGEVLFPSHHLDISHNNLGFPPPDVELRNWFLATAQNRAQAGIRSYAFLYAVFVVVLDRLKSIEAEIGKLLVT